MDEIENENLETIETEAQADELLESIEQPSSGPIEDQKVQAPVLPDEFDFPVENKTIKVKRDQLFQWAQQGRTAPGKMSQLSREVETWKKKYSEFEPKYKAYEEQYKPIDEYVKQNPTFWDHVLDSWKNKSQALTDQANPLAGVVTDLQQKVQDLIQYKNQVEDRQQKYQAQQEDQAYLQTMEEIKKTYSDIDFDTPNEEGKSLEYQVLEFAQQRGIRDFDIAFKAFKHDDLLKRAETRAKESLLKDKQKNTKLGVLGITPSPTKRVQQRDIRQRSYDDLVDEALEELGIR